MNSATTYAVLIASAIPFFFLYLIKWLNFFETHKRTGIYLALAWGAVAMVMSYLVDHPLVPIFGRPFVVVRIGPAVEEIFKSLILLYLVRRADYTYFVDGAIYGFAVGIGFAVAENMLYLSRVDANTGLIVSITRAFSSSVLHGGASALVGIAIGGFPLGRIVSPWITLFVGLAVAIAYHMLYDHIAMLPLGHEGLLMMFGLASTGLVVVAVIILWGLRRERFRLRRQLGKRAGGSKAEANLVQRIDDLGDLLEPVENRFGEAKREQVANALLLSAQLGMKQEQMRRTKDPELRAELAAHVTEAKRALKQQRDEVGIYVMSYVRSIIPKTTWSMWARLGQTLTKLEPSGSNIWMNAMNATAGASRPNAQSAVGIHARVRAALETRTRQVGIAE